MKYKKLIIITLVFFLLVNTSYFWLGKLGPLAIPAFLVLGLGFLILAIVLLQDIFFAIRERFTDKSRLIAIGVMGVTLCLAAFFPFRFINFDRLSGRDVLIAKGEGTANCTTIFKLKENNRFIETVVCFGVSETKGSYKLVNDTIFFDNAKSTRGEEHFYKFAVIRPYEFSKGNQEFHLVRFKDLTDSVGHSLYITKNDMPDAGN